MSTQRRPKALGGKAGADLYAALHRGSGLAQCYDTAAAPLYQYCWTLVGPGEIAGPDEAKARLSGSCAAVRDTLLAATSQVARLGDPADLPAWLFALARTSCRRRGFAVQSPYGSLATVDSERVVVRILDALPPSDRELLELTLRHGLTPAQRARVLGLDAETTNRLTRAAMLRAAEDLRGPGAQRALHSADLAELMEMLPPPLPPRRLRNVVLAQGAGPGSEAAHLTAARAVWPLGRDGFPLHQQHDAAPEAPMPSQADTAPAPAPAGRALAGDDRATTDDVPARRRPEQRAELAADVPAEHSTQSAPRGRRLAPAIAGVVTIAAAAGVWGLGATLSEGSGGTVVPGDSAAGDPPSAAASPDYMAEPAPDTDTRSAEDDGAAPASGSEPEAGSAPEEHTEASGGEAEDSAASAPAGETASEDGGWGHNDVEPHTSGREAGSPAPADGTEEDSDEESGGVVPGLLDGLRGLLGGG